MDFILCGDPGSILVCHHDLDLHRTAPAHRPLHRKPIAPHTLDLGSQHFAVRVTDHDQRPNLSLHQEPRQATHLPHSTKTRALFQKSPSTREQEQPNLHLLGHNSKTIEVRTMLGQMRHQRTLQHVVQFVRLTKSHRKHTELVVAAAKQPQRGNNLFVRKSSNSPTRQATGQLLCSQAQAHVQLGCKLRLLRKPS